MKKKPLLPAILAWLACFLTLTACGALWSVGGCTVGLYGRASTITEGTATGALIGLLCAWFAAGIVHSSVHETKFSDVDARAEAHRKKEWS